MIEKYFYRIFLLNILRDSKIDLIFANIKRTFKKHLCVYNSFVYSILSAR